MNHALDWIQGIAVNSYTTLKHEADLLHVPAGLRGVDIGPINEDRSRGWREDSAEVMGQGGLSRSRFANDSKTFSPLNPKRDSLKGLGFPRGPFVVDVGKICYGDHHSGVQKRGKEITPRPGLQKGLPSRHYF